MDSFLTLAETSLHWALASVSWETFPTSFTPNVSGFFTAALWGFLTQMANSSWLFPHVWLV